MTFLLVNCTAGKHLTVKTNVPNAKIVIKNSNQIYKDGILLNEGYHTLIVSKQGYHTFEKRINITQSNQYEKINLQKRNKYSLTINPIPPYASVSIMNIKKKYYAGMFLKPGKYDIEVTHPDFVTYRKWITLGEWDRTFSVKLKPAELF